jgi:hypothetical protein
MSAADRLSGARQSEQEKHPLGRFLLVRGISSLGDRPATNPSFLTYFHSRMRVKRRFMHEADDMG